PSWTAFLGIITGFETQFPQLCKVTTIGNTVEGRQIIVAHLGDNVNTEENEPEFLYSGTMHGDEVTGYVVLLRLIDYLLTNYGTNPRVTQLMNNVDIWIVPLANPDGTFAGGNNSVSGATRYNGNSVDLNRNYPDPVNGDHPDGNAWQPETEHFMAFANAHTIVAAANTHGGAEVCNYPWDTKSELHPDDEWWKLVTREYADTAQYYSPAGYLDEQNNGITNGYAWYTVDGSRQDYMNYFQNCREFTLEISGNKMPPASQLNSYWEYNYRSMLNYLEQCQYGISGLVTDSLSGEPIAATIELVGHDFDNSEVVSDMPVGDYHRPVKAGTYTVQVSAPCYATKTISGVVANDRSTTTLDVSLVPLAIPPVVTHADTCGTQASLTLHASATGGTIEWFTDATGGSAFASGESYTTPLLGSSVTYWVWEVDGAGQCYSERVAVHAVVTQNSPDAAFSFAVTDSTVDFTNTSTDATGFSWFFGDGTSSTSENPEHTYNVNGIYTVTLITTNECGTDSTSLPVTVAASDDFEAVSAFRLLIYPNPAHDKISVVVEGAGNSSFTYQITDIAGRIILSGVLSGNQATTDVSSLLAGTYVLSADNGTQRLSGLFVIDNQ
ncbi:MAG: T9SS type A sorting domain-containing protein, partial [Bacteroidetes bacterium]|nr:T9SS type A sorting domain-containing protein [Bacteroidota bacterium]